MTGTLTIEITFDLDGGRTIGYDPSPPGVGLRPGKMYEYEEDPEEVGRKVWEELHDLLEENRDPRYKDEPESGESFLDDLYNRFGAKLETKLSR